MAATVAGTARSLIPAVPRSKGFSWSMGQPRHRTQSHFRTLSVGQHFHPSLLLPFARRASVVAPTTSSSEIPSETISNPASISPWSEPFSPKKAALKPGAIAGGVVGSVGGVVMLLLGALIWKRRNDRMLPGHENKMPQSSATLSASRLSGPGDGENVQTSSELYGDNGSREMDGVGLTSQLDPSRIWYEM